MKYQSWTACFIYSLPGLNFGLENSFKYIMLSELYFLDVKVAWPLTLFNSDNHLQWEVVCQQNVWGQFLFEKWVDCMYLYLYSSFFFLLHRLLLWPGRIIRCSRPVFSGILLSCGAVDTQPRFILMSWGLLLYRRLSSSNTMWQWILSESTRTMELYYLPCCEYITLCHDAMS